MFIYSKPIIKENKAIENIGKYQKIAERKFFFYIIEEACLK